MANIGYARVSTVAQHEDRQLVMLEPIVDEMFTDKATGKNTDRPELQRMLAYIRKGDTVYFESISRLARNTMDFLKMVELFKEKQVNMISLKEHIDTTTPAGILIITVLAAIYQMELDYIKERQKEGIVVAQAKGIKFGRPIKRPKNFDKVYIKWKSGGCTAVVAARELGISISSWYRRVNEKESQIKDSSVLGQET